MCLNYSSIIRYLIPSQLSLHFLGLHGYLVTGRSQYHSKDLSIFLKIGLRIIQQFVQCFVKIQYKFLNNPLLLTQCVLYISQLAIYVLLFKHSISDFIYLINMHDQFFSKPQLKVNALLCQIFVTGKYYYLLVSYVMKVILYYEM